MLAEIRGRSQITIPSEIVKKLKINEGDKFEVTERDGGIFLCPVVVYPKEKIEKLATLLKELEGEKSENVYKDVDEMFGDMGIDLKNV